MPNKLQNQQTEQHQSQPQTQPQPQPNRRNLNTGNKSGIPKESAGKEKIHAKGEIQPFCV